MASQIHLVRHAESVHNVTKDFSTLDPSLIELGIEQAGQLVQKFTRSSSIGVIITSPLKRAMRQHSPASRTFLTSATSHQALPLVALTAVLSL
jgi:broad specificity phosphatase PhoE